MHLNVKQFNLFFYVYNTCCESDHCSIKLQMNGTKFQVKVWKYLQTIPKGQVKTYKQVAIGINRPKSARAVANACGKNPYAPKIPCHRVIRSDGSIGGVSAPGGINAKKNLLKKEGFSL